MVCTLCKVGQNLRPTTYGTEMKRKRVYVFFSYEDYLQDWGKNAQKKRIKIFCFYARAVRSLANACHPFPTQ